MALTARRLSMVAEEDGLGEFRLLHDDVDLERRASWVVPPKSKGDIQVLDFPKRKSPTTLISAPTAAVEDVKPSRDDDSKGNEEVNTDDIIDISKTENASSVSGKQPDTETEHASVSGKKPDTGGGGTGAGNDSTSNAERRQLRSFFSRSPSKDGSSVVPPALSSRVSSNSSIDSGISRTSTASRITVASSRIQSRSVEQRSSVEQRQSAKRTPSTSVEPAHVFPAGFPMDARRELEVATLQRFEKLSINPNIGEFWMVIDASWVDRWVLFVMGNAGPPGPITNHNLYSHVVPAFSDCDGVGSASGRSFLNAGGADDAVGLTDTGLAEGLKIAKHYRALHPLVWYFLEAFYGTDGAPDICRWKADIYSHPVSSVTRRLKVKTENQTKSIRLISRAVLKAKNKMPPEADRSESGSSDDGGD